MQTNATDKNKQISLRILALVASGAALKDAFDQVLGPGAFERLAGEVWDTLRAQ